MTHQGALCGGHNVGPGGAGCRRQPIGSGRGAGRDGRSLDGYHDDLGKHIYLRSVQDRDEVLFYKLLVEQFVAAVEAELPGVLVQWEDFATAHARPILLRYRDRLLSFNDDIQGHRRRSRGCPGRGGARRRQPHARPAGRRPRRRVGRHRGGRHDPSAHGGRRRH